MFKTAISPRFATYLHVYLLGIDAAGNVITAHGGRHVTVRKHPEGGAFIVKYAYYGVEVDRDGQHITVDGLDFVAVGGRGELMTAAAYPAPRHL